MRNLKRALSLTLASVMLLGMMVVGTSALSFNDADDISNVTAATILEELEIMVGDGQGNFMPDKPVSRAQMAKLVCLILYGNKLNVTQFADASQYTDVPANEWYNGYVNLASSLGIINGYGDGRFGPEDTVTTAQASLMLCRALGYFKGNEMTGDWGSDALTALTQGTKLGLFGDLRLNTNELLARDNVAEMVFNAMTQAVPVMYNKNFDIYYTDSTAWTNGVQFNWTDTLGYKNYSLAYQIDEDEFGRPTTVWGIGKVTLADTEVGGDGKILSSYKGITKDAAIIEVANSTSYSYTKKVTAKALYNDLGDTLVKDYTWKVTVNGVDTAVSPVASGKGNNGVYSTRTNDDAALYGTATGVVTEIFVDSANKVVNMSVTDTYVATVTRVKADGDKYEITVRYESAGTSAFDKTVTIDSKDFAVDDVVLITVSNNEIKTIEMAEVVEGSITAIKGTDYIKLDGTQHDVAKHYQNIANSNTSMPGINDEAKVYLDKNGYMIAVDSKGTTAEDYIYIKDDAKALGGLSAEAVFSDGTKKEIKIVKINATETFSGGEAKGKVFTFTEDDGEYTLTDPTTKLGAGTGTNGEVKKGSATVTMSNGGGSATTATATNKTVFVDVDGGKAYIGYADVASYTNATNIGAAKDGKAVIIFITKGDVSESESFWFYVKSASAETWKEGSANYFKYTVYTKDGENKEFVAKNLSDSVGGDKALLKADTIYKAKSMDSDGNLTAFDDNVDKTVTAALNAASTGNVTAAGDGVITLDGYSNNLFDTSNTKTTFTYDKDTVFIVATGKAKDSSWTTKDVGIGSAGDIGTKTNTAGKPKSTVYILNVKDKTDDTPMATLVLVVNPAEAATGGTSPSASVASTLPASIGKNDSLTAATENLAVTVSNGTAKSFQWQVANSNSSDDNDWSNVANGTGGTTAKFTPVTTATGEKWYRCVVTLSDDTTVKTSGTKVTVLDYATAPQSITWKNDSNAFTFSANKATQTVADGKDVTIDVEVAASTTVAIAVAADKSATNMGAVVAKPTTAHTDTKIYTGASGNAGKITITLTVTETGKKDLVQSYELTVQ